MLESIRSTVIMLGECVKMSLANILGNRARSFLTVLGILDRKSTRLNSSHAT